MIGLHKHDDTSRSSAVDWGTADHDCGGNLLWSRRVACYGQVAIACIALIALLLRAPDLLWHPRLWAEEATLYLTHSWLTGVKSLFAVFNGNFQLGTNLAGYFASLVPFRLAPHVTTYVSLIASISMLILLARGLAARKVAFTVQLIAIVICALQPGSYEILLNATNLQWIFALSLIGLLLIPGGHIYPKLSYAWVAFCGLNGVPSCIVAPAFLAYGWLVRSKRHLAIGGILVVCAAFQLIVIVVSGPSGRPFAFNPAVFLYSAFVQTAITPLIGPIWTDLLAGYFRIFGSSPLFILSMVVAFATVVVLSSRLPDDRRIGVVLAGAWIFVTAVQVFGAIGNQRELVSALGGARYFQFGTYCFIVLACLGTASSRMWARGVSFILIFVLCANSLAQTMINQEWAGFYLAGPRWSDEVARCISLPCKVGIWPNGWTVTLPSP